MSIVRRMRIVAGAWRGRTLVAPPGAATRPTADRVRQALFDMLLHAPWAGRDAIEGAVVLDAFAGTGALGLEALSRGAARAVFIERDRAALAALRANIAACRRARPSRACCRWTRRARRRRPSRAAWCSSIRPTARTLLPRAVAALRARRLVRAGRADRRPRAARDEARTAAWTPARGTRARRGADHRVALSRSATAQATGDT